MAPPACAMWDLSTPTRDWTLNPCSGSMESYPLDLQGSPPNLLLPERFASLPCKNMEQTGIIFGSDPSCQAHCHFNSQAGTRGADSKPPAQWAAILGYLCLTFRRPSWLTHSPAGPVVLGQGGSTACFYALIKKRHPKSCSQSCRLDWEAVQAVKFNHSHFRKWDAGGGLRVEMG